MAKVWAAAKIKVNRSATPPEEPLDKLAAILQQLEDAGYSSYTVQTVAQDISDGTWVVVYSYEP